MRPTGDTRPPGAPSKNKTATRSPRGCPGGFSALWNSSSAGVRGDCFVIRGEPVDLFDSEGTRSRGFLLMRLVIVGGVAAGTKAASRARRLDPKLEVTVYQEEPEPSISECGLPYLLSGVVEERDDLVARTPEKFAEKGIEVLVRHRVEKVDPETKKLTVRSLEGGEVFEDAYDRLIFATGARAVLPPISGADLDGVFVLRFLTDSDEVRRYVQERSPKRAVVVGGGYIGLEVAENLCRLGIEVSLIEAEDRVALAYGPEVAERVAEHLEKNGVNVYTGAKVEEFVGDGRVEGVRFGGGEHETDLAVVGI